MSWIRKDKNNNIVSVINDDPHKILHHEVACEYVESDEEYLGDYSVNGSFVGINEKHKIDNYFERLTENLESPHDLGTEIYKPRVEFDKVINFKAFMLKLSPDQRKKLLNYPKYATDQQKADAIGALIGAFNELNGLSVKSQVFTEGLVALAASNIIEPKRIDYIVG